MLTSEVVKVFSVRLPEAQRRRVKSLAASLGLSLQEAVHQALEAWVLQHDPQIGQRRDPQPAAPGGVDVDKPTRRNDPGNTARASRQAGAPRSGGPSAQARDPGAGAWAWLRDAPRLDWSQCPAVEVATDKNGRFWAFRGTRVRFAAVLLDLMNGHPMEKVLARYDGLTVDMLKAALQFAALGLAPSASPVDALGR
jgi:uncharacterized protein DUF433